MHTFWQDARHAARSLAKRRGFTLTAVLTLAFGIGANIAIFGVVETVLLRPLPFPEPERIVLVRDDLAGRGLEGVGMSVPELQDLDRRADVFEDISAVWPADANLTGGDRPERIELLAVSPNYFHLLGATAQLGRVLNPQDQADGFAEAIVISAGLWQRLFGADPLVLGRKIRLDTDLYTIVGVMPPAFRHPGPTLRDDVEVWATAGFVGKPFPAPVRRRRMLPGAVARLQAGLSLEQAQARLDSFTAGLSQEFPDDYPAEAGWLVRLVSPQELLVRDVRTTLWLLAAAVGVVLLIGALNIASLLSIRSLDRQREMAVRLALGASRRRLLGLLLMESLLLCLVSGVVAFLMVVWTKDVLLAVLPGPIPRLHELGFGGGAPVLALLLSLGSGVLISLVPAIHLSHPGRLSTLRECGQRSGVRPSQQRFRGGSLVVAEAALSLVLMIAAGLLLQSFWRVLEVRPGFNPGGVLVARTWLPVPNDPEQNTYRPPTRRAALVREILRRTRVLPGVRSVAVGSGSSVPMSGSSNPVPLVIEYRPEDPDPPVAKLVAVSGDYFRVLEVPLLRGRLFTDAEDQQASRVALIDEAAADRFWPGQDPVGRRLKPGTLRSGSAWATVVGVVGNVKTDGLDRPDMPHVYLSILQRPGYAMAVYLRADRDPESLIQDLRHQVAAVDPDLPVFGERALEDLLSSSLAQRRFAMTLVSAFGVVALLLAAIGIYGVTAYSVGQRVREIGIRMALGARPGDILRWVLGQGAVLTVAGIGVGFLGSLALTRFMRSLLFDVTPTDPVTFLALATLLAAVALAASVLPARSAIRVNPTRALRHE